MIVSVETMGREEMRGRLRGGVPPGHRVVSIIEPGTPPLMDPGDPRGVTVEFFDVDPEAPSDAEFIGFPGASGRALAMTDDDARRIVAFLAPLHADAGHWRVLVHCLAGVSRSAGVAEFCRRAYGIPDEVMAATNRRYPAAWTPNAWVTTRLLRAAGWVPGGA